MPSGYEWLIVLAVIALLFGGAKLPKLARSLGSAKGEFEKGLKDGEKASKDAATTETKAVEAPVADAAPAAPAPHVAAAEAEAAAAEAEAKAARAKAEAARLAAETQSKPTEA